ncbi:MAG: hypothetical protein M3010_07645, partial [Candidatus Dormibacteraeota bacterium]|nr:hypothetical protein [Candidatus Dormibacteraeota bacterium]
MARRPARRPGTLTLRIYTWLLRAYPAPFRRRFGAQMVQVFQDGCREARGRAGMAGLASWWLLTLRDLSGTALREHIVE